MARSCADEAHPGFLLHRCMIAPYAIYTALREVGRTDALDEPPIEWNLCRNWHFFHAIGRKNERERKGKEKKEKEKKGEKKRKEKREFYAPVPLKSLL